jgi:hypothetical protein
MKLQYSVLTSELPTARRRSSKRREKRIDEPLGRGKLSSRYGAVRPVVQIKNIAGPVLGLMPGIEM